MINLAFPDWLSPDVEEIKSMTDSDYTKIFDLLLEDTPELPEVTNPNQLYNALLYEMEDIESSRTKELRLRYQALRNLKITIYTLSLILPLLLIYAGGFLNGNIVLAIIVATLVLVPVFVVLYLVKQIEWLINIERRYIQHLIFEYLISHNHNR